MLLCDYAEKVFPDSWAFREGGVILTFQKEVKIQQFLHGNPALHDVMEINTLKYTVYVCVCVCMRVCVYVCKTAPTGLFKTSASCIVWLSVVN